MVVGRRPEAKRQCRGERVCGDKNSQRQSISTGSIDREGATLRVQRRAGGGGRDAEAGGGSATDAAARRRDHGAPTTKVTGPQSEFEKRLTSAAISATSKSESLSTSQLAHNMDD